MHRTRIAVVLGAASLLVWAWTAFVGLTPTTIAGVEVGWQVCPGIDPVCRRLLANMPDGASVTVYEAEQAGTLLLRSCGGYCVRELVVVTWRPGQDPLVRTESCGGGLTPCR